MLSFDFLDLNWNIPVLYTKVDFSRWISLRKTVTLNELNGEE